MGNELNKLLSGAFQGAGALTGGIIQNNLRKKLTNLYSSGIDKLFSFMNPPPTYQDQQGNPLSRGQTQLTDDPTQDPMQVQGQPDTKGALKSLYESTGNLMQYGDEGKQYAGLLSNLYQGMQPPEPPKKDIRVVGNQLVDITDPNNMKVLMNELKPNKVINNPETYGTMTMEQALKLPPDELKKGIYYFSPEVQEQLTGKYTVLDKILNPEKYKEISGSRRTGSRRLSTKKNVDTQDELDLENIDSDMPEDVKDAITTIEGKTKNAPEIQQQREVIASELKDFEDLWAGGKVSQEEFVKAVNDYLAELEADGTDEDVLNETFNYIKKRATELGIAF